MLFHTVLAIALTSPLPHRSVIIDSTAIDARAERVATRRYTTFGVAIAPVPANVRAMPYLEPDEGVMLAQIQRRSAAEAAGLLVGDLVLRIDGKPVDETTIFLAVRQAPRNKAFRIEYLRDNRWREAWVKIDE